MEEAIAYEVWEINEPSYLSTYILSGFVLLGLLGLAKANVPLWPLGLEHLFFAVWFGVLFRWILLTARQQRIYMSNRFVLTTDAVRTSFRYAVAENIQFQAPISDLEEVYFSRDLPKLIAMRGKGEVDMVFLPESADYEAIKRALLRKNPSIKVSSQPFA